MTDRCGEMTAGMNLQRALSTNPDDVTSAVLKVHSKRYDVIYSSPIWRLIMLALGSLAQVVFTRLSI